jgi:predicted acylesterase/phospholipase RssA
MTLPDGAELRRLGWGLALSGGGAKGAYCAGVVRALHTAGVFEDDLSAVWALHGVSTGALIAGMLALGRVDDLERIYTTVTTPEVVQPSHKLAYKLFGIEGTLALSAALGPPYIFSTKPLRKLVARHLGEDLGGFRRILDLKERLDVGFTSVDLADGRIGTYGNGNLGDPALLRDALLASTNQPVLMDLVKIGGPGQGHEHCDGGVRDFLPVNQVMRSRFASRIDVIVSVPLAEPGPPPGSSEYRKIMDILVRTIGILSYDVGDNDIKGAQFVDALLRVREALLAQGEEGERLWKAQEERFQPYVREFLGAVDRKREAFEFIVVQPKELKFKDPLIFDPKEMVPAFRQGVEDGRAALETWWTTRGHRCRPKYVRP